MRLFLGVKHGHLRILGMTRWLLCYVSYMQLKVVQSWACSTTSGSEQIMGSLSILQLCLNVVILRSEVIILGRMVYQASRRWLSSPHLNVYISCGLTLAYKVDSS